jgi:hypothetical protein
LSMPLILIGEPRASLTFWRSFQRSLSSGSPVSRGSIGSFDEGLPCGKRAWMTEIEFGYDWRDFGKISQNKSNVYRHTRAGSQKNTIGTIMALIVGKGERSGESFIDGFKGFKGLCVQLFWAIQVAGRTKVTTMR